MNGVEEREYKQSFIAARQVTPREPDASSTGWTVKGLRRMGTEQRGSRRNAFCVAVLRSANAVADATVACNLASALAAKGLRTLLVLPPPPGQAAEKTSWDDKPSFHQMLTALAEFSYARTESEFGSYDLLIASSGSANDMGTAPPFQRPQRLLKLALDPYRDDYDYIVIDCPSSPPVSALNGLSAAQAVLLPLLCEFNAINELSKRVSQVKSIKQTMNPELGIAGILRLEHSTEYFRSSEFAVELESHFWDRLLRTAVTNDGTSSNLVNFTNSAKLSESARPNGCNFIMIADEVIERCAKLRR